MQAHNTITSDTAEVDASRTKLLGALSAMEKAFLASDLAAARGHLETVDIASSVAEDLLRPRRTLDLQTALKPGAST